MRIKFSFKIIKLVKGRVKFSFFDCVFFYCLALWLKGILVVSVRIRNGVLVFYYFFGNEDSKDDFC